MKTIIKYIFYFNLSIASLLYATENSFFVSLRSNEVNLRNGPGNEYPIKYIYKIKGKCNPCNLASQIYDVIVICEQSKCRF